MSKTLDHTITLTDDQLTVAIGLIHVGAASIAGDEACYIEALELLASVEDHEKRAEELQGKLISASDPEGWERTMNAMVAMQRRN